MFSRHIQGAVMSQTRQESQGWGLNFFLTFREGIQRILGHFYLTYFTDKAGKLGTGSGAEPQ